MPDTLALSDDAVSVIPVTNAQAALIERYQEVRRLSETLCEPLVTEDYVIQSMPDVSPTKWHLAHTSWFFETFVLEAKVSGYRPFHPDFSYLFNSYYNAVGERHCRPKRGVVSRPTVEETYAYRAFVDGHMLDFLYGLQPNQWLEIEPLVMLGIHHEQQHQELMLTDIKHVFTMNPLRPVYRERQAIAAQKAEPLQWITYPEGIYRVGHEGGGFAFDNEGPRHRKFLEPFALASRLVTNGEYLAFMEDGGYKRPELWLSMGWATVQENGWKAPFYWEIQNNRWFNMTLAGMRPVEEAEPVCHISYFEADAYARWAAQQCASVRLPTEAEWEVASWDVPIEGNFVESSHYHPAPDQGGQVLLAQMFGDVWQWTRSQYVPYAGYAATADALGEYNGKFMCNQFVLRGGSCVTSRSHIRRTYRNFFPPDTCWQFTGIRPVLDLHDFEPEEADFRAEVLHGLLQEQKTIPCKFFYDSRGSQLFDRICELEEYYPTRTESEIMSGYAEEIAALLGENCLLLEYGSGSSIKTRILLDHLPSPVGYVPIDISREHLMQSAASLALNYPQLKIWPVCADYTSDFELPLVDNSATRRIVYFPGSTIGNFDKEQTHAFLCHVAEVCGVGGGLLIGVDLKKDAALLEAAYNDSQEVTAAFNLNVLERINRELGANFLRRQFKHHAFYNAEAGRIEMHLVSLCDQQIQLPLDTSHNAKISFKTGESILTEYCYKYSLLEFEEIAANAGLKVEKIWIDSHRLFSVQYLKVR